MKKTLSWLLLLLAVGSFVAQSQTLLPDRHFCGIESAGPMPDDLRKNLEQLYSEDRQRVKDYNNGKLANRDRILTSSYNISRLMASAHIMYGDPITKMVNSIADTLLHDYPELRRQLRFYTVRSTEVNAFATGQGMIFVNMGLVAQVEDEAQLAFVLSHEIIHYLRKHNLENILRKKIRRDPSDNDLTAFLRYHSRSREMESEADSLGIAMLYGQSPYDKRVSDGFFDVLQYGYLPFDEMAFDTTRYNTPYYTVSSGTFLTAVAPISAREDYNDSLSTHPNLLKRRLATTRQLSSLSGGSHYVVTNKPEFEKLRMLARMECIREDLIDAEYASAYYNCYVLLKDNPDNEYLKYAMAQAIYGAAKFRTYSAASNTSDYRNKEGEIQQVYHFLRRCKPEELCMIAIRELYRTERELGGDTRLHQMMTDLMSDLGSRHNYKPDNFSATFDTLQNDTTSAASNNNNSKYKRRRKAQQSREAKRFVFIDIMEQDKAFQTLLNNSLTSKREEPLADTSRNCFIFAPGYYVFNSKTEETKIKKSYNNESQLIDDLSASIRKNGLNVVDFSEPMMRSKGETDFYNDYVRLNDWTNELSHSMGKVPLFMATQPVMDSVVNRYGTDKLALSMVLNYENQQPAFGTLYTIFFSLPVITAPLAIYFNSSSYQSTMVYNALVNTRNGSILNESKTILNHGDGHDMIRSQQFADIQQGINGERVPGYMGKYFIVSGMAGLSFPIINRPFREKTDAFALRWGAEVEAVVGRNLSLYGAFDYGKTKFDITYETQSPLAKISTYSLGLRFYLGNDIAPLGPYFGWGATMNNINLIPVNGQLMVMENNYKRWAMRLEFGHQSILGDIISLNLSVCHDLTFANPFSKLDESYYYSYNGMVNHIRSFNANVWIYNMISLRLRIGLIPF
ncbi:MAG: M48 family metalloprotease [Bacteroidales bacterium]|nr:M48 family metalloprotease [Bacteroidales bacterium]